MVYFESPFDLPEQRFVGVLSCQIDPFLQSLETVVVGCEAIHDDAPTTNQAKKAQKSSKKQSQAQTIQYGIRLKDSVCFPEGGGQPWDLGWLQILDSEESIPVTKVIRHGVQAIHHTLKPLDIGTRVRVVVDWGRRMDLMTQHTGQHLLSSVLEHMHGLDTLGWNLSPFPEPSYVELNRVPTKNEIASTIETCNRLIRDNVPLHVDIELEGNEPRPPKIPADYQQGVIRHVTITSSELPNDRNPCCGTHVKSLGHLQALHVLPKTTPIRGTNCRLYFLVGQRILENLKNFMSIAQSTALAFGCAVEDTPVRAEQALTNLKETSRREKRLRDELAERLARDLVVEADQSGFKSALLLREEDELDFLSAVVDNLKDSGNDHLYILASNNSPSSPIMILAPPERLNTVASQLKSQFEGRIKGGGKGSWQGKLEGRFKKGDVDILRGLLGQGCPASQT